MTKSPPRLDHPHEPSGGHIRVLGLPGSGKTRALVDSYRARRVQSAAPAFIVTYSRDQLLRVTRELLCDGEAEAGPAPVQTYYSLASEIIAASGRRQPRVIGSIEERLLVERVVERSLEGMKSDLRNIATSAVFQREVISYSHRLLQNGVRGESLSRMRRAVSDKRVADLILLYEEFVRILERDGLATYYDLSFHAARSWDGVPEDHAFRRACCWLVDDFQDCDPGQFQLLTTVVPPDGPAMLEVYGDPMGSYFGFRGTDVRFLLEELPARYAPQTVSLPGACLDEPSLGAVLRGLAAERGKIAEELQCPQSGDAQASPDLGPLFAVPPDRGKVDWTLCRDEVEEVYTAARRVHDLVVRDHRNPEEIAVVANDKRVYEPIMRTAFAQWGLPLDAGREGSSSFHEFVRAVLRLVEWPRDPVGFQALWASGFYPHFARSCLDASWREGGDAEHEAGMVARFAEERSAEMGATSPAHRLRMLLRGCILPTCERYRQESGDESVFETVSALSERWKEYADAAEQTGHVPRFDAFVRTSGVFDAVRKTPVPESGHVGLYSAREIKGRFFPVVFIVGCAEMLFPAPKRRSTLVPAEALQALLAEALAPGQNIVIHEAQSPEDHLSEEHHLLYQALTRATERLSIFSPESFAGQTRPAPSAIIAEYAPELPRQPDCGSERVPPPIRIARAVSATRDSRRDERLAALCAPSLHWHDDVRPVPFSIAEFRLSKSSLEGYLRCPRRFFYTRVLRIREDETGAQVTGQLFHEVMASLCRRFPTKQSLHAGVEDALIEAESRTAMMGKRHVARGGLLSRSLVFHLKAMVKSALWLDRQDQRDYRVEAVEEKIEFNCNGWPFTARADLVQRTREGVTLLDYKTGEVHKMGNTIRSKIVAVDRAEEIEWQIPLYVWGYRDAGGEWPDAFRYLVRKANAAPYFVTLLVRESEHDLPPEATSRKRTDKEYSYLLWGEVQAVVEQAAHQARTIFGDHEAFSRTEERASCRICTFARVCDRVTE